MKSTQKKRIFMSILVVLCAIGIWINFRKTQLGNKNSQKTIDQVLRERSLESQKVFTTPIGTLFRDKNWNELKKSLMAPKANFHDFAEAIRASYINQSIDQFTQEDHAELMEILTELMEKISDKDFHHSGLLITQFFRLPLPPKESSSYQRIFSWIEGTPENVELKRIGTFKIALQELNPPKAATDAFAAGLGGKTEGFSKEEWIRSIDDIRDPKVRTKMSEVLVQKYDSLSMSERAIALVTLSHQAEHLQKFLVKNTFHAYQVDDQATFEAALKATKALIDEHLLNSKEEKNLVKILTETPSSRKTPFVVAKIDELISSLTKK